MPGVLVPHELNSKSANTKKKPGVKTRAKSRKEEVDMEIDIKVFY
jgi:hypothetical protein